MRKNGRFALRPMPSWPRNGLSVKPTQPRKANYSPGICFMQATFDWLPARGKTVTYDTTWIC